MEIPTYTFDLGTRVGTVVRYNGSYADKRFRYLDKNDEFRCGTVRTYNQPVWYWTGYRWIRYGKNNDTEARRDKVRANLGMVIVNNEWKSPT